MTVIGPSPQSGPAALPGCDPGGRRGAILVLAAANKPERPLSDSKAAVIDD
jgi:hypothetical protein